MKRMWMLLCLLTALILTAGTALAESPYEKADKPLPQD